MDVVGNHFHNQIDSHAQAFAREQAKLATLDVKVHVIADRLEAILQRVASRMTMQEVNAASRVEELEATVESFANTLSDVCDFIGLEFNPPSLLGPQHRIPQLPATKINWLGRPSSVPPEQTNMATAVESLNEGAIPVKSGPQPWYPQKTVRVMVDKGVMTEEAAGTAVEGGAATAGEGEAAMEDEGATAMASEAASATAGQWATDTVGEGATDTAGEGAPATDTVGGGAPATAVDGAPATVVEGAWATTGEGTPPTVEAAETASDVPTAGEAAMAGAAGEATTGIEKAVEAVTGVESASFGMDVDPPPHSAQQKEVNHMPPHPKLQRVPATPLNSQDTQATHVTLPGSSQADRSTPEMHPTETGSTEERGQTPTVPPAGLPQ